MCACERSEIELLEIIGEPSQRLRNRNRVAVMTLPSLKTAFVLK